MLVNKFPDRPVTDHHHSAPRLLQNNELYFIFWNLIPILTFLLQWIYYCLIQLTPPLIRIYVKKLADWNASISHQKDFLGWNFSLKICIPAWWGHIARCLISIECHCVCAYFTDLCIPWFIVPDKMISHSRPSFPPLPLRKTASGSISRPSFPGYARGREKCEGRRKNKTLLSNGAPPTLRATKAVCLISIYSHTTSLIFIVPKFLLRRGKQPKYIQLSCQKKYSFYTRFVVLILIYSSIHW